MGDDRDGHRKDVKEKTGAHIMWGPGATGNVWGSELSETGSHCRVLSREEKRRGLRFSRISLAIGKGEPWGLG